jgi:hypothetical protein
MHVDITSPEKLNFSVSSSQALYKLFKQALVIKMLLLSNVPVIFVPLLHGRHIKPRKTPTQVILVNEWKMRSAVLLAPPPPLEKKHSLEEGRGMVELFLNI